MQQPRDVTLIDIHCHYLPGVDDGPAEIQDSIALMRLAVRDGARRIVLTPHVFPWRWPNTLATLQPRFNAFSRLIASKGIDVELFLGGEVHLVPELLDMVERREVPFIGGWEGEKALLLEMHDGQVPPFALGAVRVLRQMGIRPVIAHPERNREIMANPDRLEPFILAGCLVQVTAGSLIGRFGPKAGKAALALLDRGWVHFVATDAHNLRHRPPQLSAARAMLEDRHGLETAERLTSLAPGAVVAGRAALGLDPASGLQENAVRASGRQE